MAGEHGPFYEALEKKTPGNIRRTVSNASHVSQGIVLKALQYPDFHRERAEKVKILKGRANRVKAVVSSPKYADAWKMYSFNSGYFMCLQLKTVEAGPLRVHLLDKYQTGLIATGRHDLRVAFSSADEENLEPLFEIICKGIKYTDPILVFSGILFAFRQDCGKMTVLIRKICGNRFGKGCFLSSAIFVPKKTKIGSV